MSMDRGASVTLVNLTPHNIVICDENCKPILLIPRSGTVARVKQTRKIIKTIRVRGIRIQKSNAEAELVEVEVPISRNEYGEVEGLPEPREGVYYIVSMMVAQALPHRRDLLIPDTGPDSACRDENGRIIGVKYLQYCGR